MARPKRTRQEAATVSLPPTTRRRRSQPGYELPPPAPKGTRSASAVRRVEEEEEKPTTTTTTAPAKAAATTTDDLGNDHAVEEEKIQKKTISQEELNRKMNDISTSESQKDTEMALEAKSETTNDPSPSVVLPSLEEPATIQTNETKNRIRLILEHRKVLLQRLVQGRAAAQKRLALTDASISDEQETVEFAETMKKVSALARKQAQAENSAAAASSSEPRRSLVSLRRGNSVGKRMNAAISTLMGSHSEGLSSSSTGVVPVKLSLPPTAVETNGVTVTARGGGILLAAQSGSSAVLPKSAIKRSDSTVSRTTALKKSFSGRSDIPSHQAMHPPHFGMLSPHRIHVPHASPPRVICPETAALRRRRDQIRLQLTQRRQNRSGVPSEASPVIKPAPERTIPSPSRASVAMKLRLRSSSSATPRTWQGPDLAPDLPPRRKTHWDVVLEEMRWMATDFLEEQKWKRVTARVIARQAQQSHLMTLPPPPPSGMLESTHRSTDARLVNKDRLVPKLDTLSVEASPLTSIAMIPSSLELEPKAGTLRFQKMTAEDECGARIVAKQISILVLNVVTANNATGRLPPTTVPVDCPKSIWTDGSEVTPSTKSSISSSNNNQTAIDTTLENSGRAEMFRRASDYVDQVMGLLSNQSNGAKMIADSTEETSGLQLSIEQNEAMEIIEDRWHRIGIGAVLCGSLASGKTIVACSLLCRHRQHGPQLLVCSSSNMIRWMHELRRFKQLNIKFLDGLSVSATTIASLLANDVIVCLHSTVVQIPNQLLSKFSSVIIDGRHPSGFSSSRPPSSVTDESFCAPGEFSSCVWWTKLALSTSDGDFKRRLVLESNNRDKAPSYLRNMPSRQYLEVLSLRMTFLLGAKNFISPIFPLGKAILAWARHRIKNSSLSGSKFHQVNALLVDLTKPLYCSIKSDTDLLGENVLQLGNYSYEIRHCTMTSNERTAYSQACRQSRSFLSSELDVKDKKAFANIAGALLLLRRHCTHPNMSTALRSVRLQSSISDNDEVLRNDNERLRTTFISACSPSQRNLDLAFRILSDSSKLCLMVSILLADYGVEITGDASSIIAVLTKDSDLLKVRMCKKVAIVAALPEVQLLASALLNAIGIVHEVFVKPVHDSSISRQPQGAIGREEAMSWGQAQNILSKFNSLDDPTTWMVNHVVTSLPSVSGEHGGLGVESSDTIIVLDEDWSGREEFLLRSLICRCSRKRKFEGKDDCRVLRLVTDGTCEDVFLAWGRTSSVSKGSLSDMPSSSSWPMTPFGTFSSNKIDSFKGPPKQSPLKNGISTATLDMFCFPGGNVLCLSGRMLDEVVGSSPMPQQFRSCSDCPRFLPFLSEGNTVDIGVMIVSYIVKKEESSRMFQHPTASCRSKSISISSILPHLHAQILSTCDKGTNLPPCSLRMYLRRIHDIFSSQDHASGVVLANNLTPSFGVDQIGETLDRVGRDVPLTLDRSPSKAAFSVLFYANQGVETTEENSAFVKTNFYASSFSSANTVSVLYDGNLGSEALIYFPPVFPMMHEYAGIAKKEHEFDRSSAMESITPVIVDPNAQSNATDVIENDVNDYGLAGSGAMPLPVDSAYKSCHTITRHGKSNDSSSGLLSDWFSSAPLVDAEEFQASLHGRISANNMSRSMIVLLSRKRRRGQANTLQFGRPNIGSWNGSSTKPDASVFADFNGVGKKGKKPVSAFGQLPLADNLPQRPPTQTLIRKDDYRYRLLSTLRQSGLGTTIFEAPIFRVASLRVRSKVAERILRESWASDPTYEAIPGLVSTTTMQHSSGTAENRILEAERRTWTTVANPVQSKNSTSLGNTHELSVRQTEWFRRSYAGPQRVDFGPFRCGYISSSDNSIGPLKPRVGISLPMGVKISLISKEQTLVSWDDWSDNILRQTVQRFGENWILVAKVVSGFQGLSYCAQAESKLYRSQRSLRSCRERWLHLASDIPALSQTTNDEVNNTAEGGDSGRRLALPNNEFVTHDHGEAVTFLVPLVCDDVSIIAHDAKPTLPDNAALKERKPRRTFKAFQLGLAKQQATSPSPPVATAVIPPCHPSHEVAVQISISAANGRTDMWPLQILDGADRHRAAAAAATVSTSVPATVSTSTTAVSRRAVSMTVRSHSSNSNSSARNRNVSSTNRSPSTGTVPVQRTPVVAPVAQRPPVPYASSASKGPVSNASQVSKQSFAPPPPSTKSAAASPSKGTPPVPAAAVKEDAGAVAPQPPAAVDASKPPTAVAKGDAPNPDAVAGPVTAKPMVTESPEEKKSAESVASSRTEAPK